MPRAGQVKPPTDERLSDGIAIGLLTRAFPPGVVDAVVASTDRGEVRSRLLPARVVVYYVLAMCLFSGQGYEEVMRLLVGGLEWLGRWRRVWAVPSTAAIAKARARLGAQPLGALFAAVVRPLATDATRGAWCGGPATCSPCRCCRCWPTAPTCLGWWRARQPGHTGPGLARSRCG